MTASEFTFLALGLILGLATGAALVELIRARPLAPREVRLTVSHDAIPRRATTLADDAFTAAGPEPARGGPADRRTIGIGVMDPGRDRRTHVLKDPAPAPVFTTASPSVSPTIAVPVGADPHEPVPGRILEPALPLREPALPLRTPGASGLDSGSGSPMVGIPIGGDSDPRLDVLETGARSSTSVSTAPELISAIATAARVDRNVPRSSEPVGFGRVGIVDAPLDGRQYARHMPEATPAPRNAARPAAEPVVRPAAEPAVEPVIEPIAPPSAAERCAELRLLADERCELATRARAQAASAVDALRAAQRTYDEHEAAAVTATWRADPRAVHDAKDAAQGGFRTAVAGATTPDQLEAAARDWLTEINRINTEAREATAMAKREHAAAATIGATLERLGLEADAARISAENADASCLSARVALADCDEQTSADRPPAPADERPDARDDPRLDEDERLGFALDGDGTPRIFRLLRGDRAAMTSLIASLAGDDRDERRRWQLQMTSLVEAIVADAIQASALDFSDDHEFWGTFSKSQSRDIVQALSSLGYRFDGLRGWADERYPSQRDLSLALGYAGLDPMRMRRWPTEASMKELFHDVTVAADEYLAEIAGDLTLAEMVAMLGRRADGLAEVWNDWGRIRPLLLDES